MSDPAHVKLIDEMGQGVNQLKIAFSRKMSVPKYNIIHLVHDSNASLKISYFAAQAEDPAKETILGTVEDPNVSKNIDTSLFNWKKSCIRECKI